MKANLINIGRSNVNREIKLPNFDSDDLQLEFLLKEVSKHLMSRDISIEETSPESNEFTVYAGCRSVGKVLIHP